METKAYGKHVLFELCSDPSKEYEPELLKNNLVLVGAPQPMTTGIVAAVGEDVTGIEVGDVIYTAMQWSFPVHVEAREYRFVDSGYIFGTIPKWKHAAKSMTSDEYSAPYRKIIEQQNLTNALKNPGAMFDPSAVAGAIGGKKRHVN